jgi:hypothetical protein
MTLPEALRVKRLVERWDHRCLVARLNYAEGEGYTVMALDVCAGRNAVLRRPDDWRQITMQWEDAEAGGTWRRSEPMERAGRWQREVAAVAERA